MRWHHARLGRLEAARAAKQSAQSYWTGLETHSARADLDEARRIESRYKRRLSQSCEKASDKPPQHEVITI